MIARSSVIPSASSVSCAETRVHMVRCLSRPSRPPGLRLTLSAWAIRTRYRPVPSLIGTASRGTPANQMGMDFQNPNLESISEYPMQRP